MNASSPIANFSSEYNTGQVANPSKDCFGAPPKEHARRPHRRTGSALPRTTNPLVVTRKKYGALDFFFG
jgi:hypothetical protein